MHITTFPANENQIDNFRPFTAIVFRFFTLSVVLPNIWMYYMSLSVCVRARVMCMRVFMYISVVFCINAKGKSTMEHITKAMPLTIQIALRNGIEQQHQQNLYE